MTGDASRRANPRFPESRGELVDPREEQRKRWKRRDKTPSFKPRDGAAASKSEPRPQHRGPKPTGAPTEEMRIAKAMARAGLCSRREAEAWIAAGRVKVNGKDIASPALNVGPRDRVEVDGQLLPMAEPPRLWRYHKPKGLVTTHKDPEGRPTVFDKLPEHMPRVISIGRLDFNTEGLLLLTNDGELARHLELPATGWLRRYRVRAHGEITQARLDPLKDGIELDGVRYGPIEATLDQVQGANVWMTIGLREGKNREVRKIMDSLGLTVNRLIRVSFGPFQLLDLAPGDVESVKRRVLADQLGPELSETFSLMADREPPAPRRPGKRAMPPRDRD
jgi:23S rRNA pseudouridine2605 synthase